MAFAEQVTCDICRKPKQQTNHWFMYQEDPLMGILFAAWDEQSFKAFKHLCGQECLTQAVNRWMGEQSK